jgi:hypothetical protein
MRHLVQKVITTFPRVQQCLLGQNHVRTPKENRILIIHPHPDVDSSLTMTFLLESLAERKMKVDVLHAYGGGFPSPKPFGDTIHLQSLPYSFFLRPYFYNQRSFPKRLFDRVRFKLLHPGRQFDYPLKFDPFVFGLLDARRYSVIVGVDPFGIALADLVNKWAKRPLVYISFEMLFADELVSEDEHELRKIERAACERTSLVLIQDDERADLFCREVSFDRHKIITVPVAPIPPGPIKSNYLRECLGIPSHKKIVLFCGNLCEWSARDQLAEMVSYWPEKYCLVIHLPSKVDKRLARYLKRLSETGRIYISSEPLPRENMPQLIASADFGLAPYLPVPDHWWTGDNLYYLGFASSKVSSFAACGLPMLVRSLPVFDREFAKYQCGKVYQRIADTGQMLAEMDQSYAHYSAEAHRFYQERLNPVQGMRKFCDQLSRLAETGIENEIVESCASASFPR